MGPLLILVVMKFFANSKRMFQSNASSACNPITYAKPAPNTYYITIILVQIAFEH